MTLAPAPSPIPDIDLPADIDTPAVVIHRDRLEANIAALQAALDARGVALRPHIKTHKSLEIGRLQLAAGARGITVGTLGEAEVFIDGGFDDVFLGYPLWADGGRASRLRGLHDTGALRVGVDSAEGAERLAAAVAGARAPLHVLVEVDSGAGRTGVTTAEAAASVARAAVGAGLVVDGVFTHGGHSYAPGRAPSAADDEVERLTAAAEAIESAGIPVDVVSAGSTPTRTGAARGRVNEVRAGTYVVGDRQQWALGAVEGPDVAIAVAATVVSASEGRFVVDAGAKALTKDRADWLNGFGHLPSHPASVIERLYDYHGAIRLGDRESAPALGTRLAIVPNHACPVIDLFDELVVLCRDGAIERWPVDARGRSG